MLLLRVLSIIFPVFAIILLGYLYGRAKRPELGVVNQLNMDVFIPALMFHALAGESVNLASYIPLALAGAVIVLGSGLLAWPLCRWLKVAPLTFVPVMMFSNSGNLFIPITLLMFGNAVLPAVAILFLVETTLHLTVGLRLLDRRSSLLGLLKMPVILLVILGIAFSLLHIQLPASLNVTIKMVGDICVPLMLFALGARLTDVSFKDWRLGLWGAVLAPLTGIIMLLLFMPLLHLPRVEQQLLIVFAALPPAVMNYLIAEQYRQEPEKVASIVMLSNMGSLVFLPLAIGFVLRG